MADGSDIANLNSAMNMFADSSNVVVAGKNSIIFAVFNTNIKDTILGRGCTSRIRPLTNQIVMTYAGDNVTGKEIWLEAKKECDEFDHGPNGPTLSYIANYVAGLLQNVETNIFTIYIIAGYDENGMHIYKISKYGIEFETDAAIIGFKQDEAMNYLAANYDPNSEVESLIRCSIGCLLMTEQSGLAKFELTVLHKDKPMVNLDVADIADHIDMLFTKEYDLIRDWLTC